MSAWITLTPSLQKAVEIINGLDPAKFRLLLSRITQTMQSGSGNEKPFTTEEEEKLQTSLELDKRELKLLLDSTTFIIEQAAYHMTKPAVFHRHLQDSLKLNEEKVETFVNIWTSSAKGIVDQLRKRSVFPAQLDDIRWSLNLQAASDRRIKQKIPKAVFQFGIKVNDGGKNNREKVTVDFNHEELYEFYKKLETIQAQLDSLR
ncbi:COMM domain-containing protein 10 [Anabrus simplex]|uniref:COMM domain-containing protein 10 n=1 Tax=Anabrus simplex TaxID=316456 RepID=UPI0035A318A2